MSDRREFFIPEMTKDFYQWRIYEWSYWHRSIVSKALDSFKRKSFNVHSLAFSVRSPGFRDQFPESSVQSLVFTVQRPESSVQLLRPESRNPGMPSHRVLISICLIFCQFQSGVAYKSKNAAYKKCVYVNSTHHFPYSLRCHYFPVDLQKKT